jgi:hypothetical protein
VVEVAILTTNTWLVLSHILRSRLNEHCQDYDGGKSIRVLNPCTGDAASFGPQCQWFDNATQLAMIKKRWYSTAEPMANGTVAIIGSAHLSSSPFV